MVWRCGAGLGLALGQAYPMIPQKPTSPLSETREWTAYLRFESLSSLLLFFATLPTTYRVQVDKAVKMPRGPYVYLATTVSFLSP